MGRAARAIQGQGTQLQGRLTLRLPSVLLFVGLFSIQMGKASLALNVDKHVGGTSEILQVRAETIRNPSTVHAETCGL